MFLHAIASALAALDGDDAASAARLLRAVLPATPVVVGAAHPTETGGVAMRIGLDDDDEEPSR